LLRAGPASFSDRGGRDYSPVVGSIGDEGPEPLDARAHFREHADHLGRFAGEYRKSFGVAPSATLRLACGAADD